MLPLTKKKIVFKAKKFKKKPGVKTTPIKKVYEVFALTCKKCGGEMKVISVITDHETIKQILKHLGRWNIRCHSPPPLPNIHPSPDIDSPGDVEKYFQDFIPSDDEYIVDQPFFP